MGTSILTDPALTLTALVTILALLLYLYMGAIVGAMRNKYDVKPPASMGAPAFERAFRAHQNTLESLPVFLVPLWLAAFYFQPARWLPAVVALAWIAGRFLYLRGYLLAPEKRLPGLRIQSVAILVNMVLAVAGILVTNMT